MSDTFSDPASDDAASLEALVGDWLTVPDLVEALDLPLRQVHRMIDERQVLAHRVGERRVIAVPAAFVQEGEIVPSLRGTITVLADSGLTDVAALTWLFTRDETLPLPGTPMEMLRVGRKAEIRRRASELA